MAHFAKVQDGIVTEVLVVEKDFIDSGAVGDPAQWVQTSYNTRGGVYYTPNTNEPDPDQSKAFRKNYAGIGFTYDRERDAFIPPKPFDSWLLDDFSCLWKSPVPYPTDGKEYYWDEDTLSWIEIVIPTPLE